MKKTLVAAGVIVALGVVWTGGAWVSRKQPGKPYVGKVQQANRPRQNNPAERGGELAESA